MSAHTYTKVRNCDTLIVLFVSHVSHMPFPMFPWQYMYLSDRQIALKIILPNFTIPTHFHFILYLESQQSDSHTHVQMHNFLLPLPPLHDTYIGTCYPGSMS